ncbi:response regulator transcription factor [Leifsonia sp. McL0607]|uniref:helix-turn-helix transcriptional regulator n=1 Tax=Leifsonia sp. McL0607 TaxID=3415672 RepID=UPI003CE9F147
MIQVFVLRSEWLEDVVSTVERSDVTLSTIAELLRTSIPCDGARYRDLDSSSISPLRSERWRGDGEAHASVLRSLDGGGHQLDLVTSLHPPFAGQGWTLMRWGRSFSDHDVETATTLLPLVAVLTKRALRSGVPGEPVIALTQRERVILARVARGWTASRIAHELAISERTVGKHLEHAYRKMEVGDRLSAVRRAIELELI